MKRNRMTSNDARDAIGSTLIYVGKASSGRLQLFRFTKYSCRKTLEKFASAQEST